MDIVQVPRPACVGEGFRVRLYLCRLLNSIHNLGGDFVFAKRRHQVRALNHPSQIAQQLLGDGDSDLGRSVAASVDPRLRGVRDVDTWHFVVQVCESKTG